MKPKYYLFILTSVLLISITSFQLIEDSVFIKRLKESLKQYHSDYPEEIVYLQLDKPFYKPGEDIWFNVFVLNSNTHKPTTISDVVYVELIDPKGNITSKLDLVVREGTAHGDVALQFSAPGGLYQIRAYTHWMKNFGKDNFFKKEIQVQRIVTPRLLLKIDFEKESYGAGEQVSAKLTITNLKNEKVTNASINVSVKIDGISVLASSLHSDAQGQASINFDLPDTLNSTDGLLQAIVETQNVEESISRSIPIVLNKITIQFLPEGGTWIYDINSTMAFKALNEFGKSADVAGVILDDKNNVLTNFESFHMGMGAFQLKPTFGTKYYARIESPAGGHSLIALPDPSPAGYVLNLLEKTDTTLHWAVHSNAMTDIHLVGQSHGEIYHSETFKLQAGENRYTVSTKDFPDGISVFTLFDANGIEQCERLAFINNDKGLKIELKTDKKRYLPREIVQLEIRTLNRQGKPIPSKISLAVVDDQLITFADDKQDNILSSFLLSSEVKGEIQEPSFYFDPNEPKASKALDYLLMTQGWRRFSWKEVLDNNRTITYSAEKNKNIGGVLLNGQGIGFSGEVTLLELGGKKRIVKVQTTKEGYFVFKNIDPTISLLLLTKKPGELVLKKEGTFSISLNDKEGTVILQESVTEVQTASVATDKSQGEDVSAESGLNMSLGADVTQLSEVVVTAFGVAEKRSLAGSVVTIQENTIESMFAASSVENALQGRVAGVLITPQTGNPGAQSNLTVRGLSSLAGGRSEPLYVIDGHPIGTSLNQNFSNGSMLGPDDIQTIEVINSPEATALYGSAAANGVILITTRSRIGYYHFQSKKKPSNYSSLTITPRKFSPAREFYIPPPADNNKEVRKDFRTTVYWNHTIITDENGKANLSFYNNDAVSAFRITAEGFSRTGLLGRNEEVYYTELPLSLDVKMPEILGYEDILKLPVRIKNETSTTLSGVFSLSLPPELAVKESTEQNVSIAPKSIQTLLFTIHPKGIEGQFPISLKLTSGDYKDEMKHILQVKPIGFPVRLSFSSKELEQTIQFSILDAERNSVKAELTAFPDILSDLFTGAESILREPYGCFEQVSSSTFPNILALQFLKQSGLISPTIEKRALTFIQNGYAKLVAYEIKGGGFEWFGHPPAHEGLTAYGLLQFYEMNKVFAGVDEKMLNRTRDWLLNKRTGKGGFKQSSGKYGFSAASEDVTNAYITYTLSETGSKDILPEFNYALAEVVKSNDMYRMALVASAAFNLGRINDYTNLINIFKETVKFDGFGNLKAEHSIVRSYGNSLQIETISLWTVALMKHSTPDLDFINKCIQHILSARAHGQFGSMQGTTLALKALAEYANLVRTTREAGTIQIFADNKLVDKLNYEKDVREKLVLRNFINDSNGDQTLRIRFDGTTEPLPYSVDIQWHTKKPQSSERCQVSLATSLSESTVRLNETVRLSVSVKNKMNVGLPMTVAVIGIPAGLSAQPWQLKEFQEKEVFDFYEIIGGNLILYFREISPSGEYKINLDLKAEIPGTFLGGASSAYLYYTNEYRHWVTGNSIVIQ